MKAHPHLGWLAALPVAAILAVLMVVGIQLNTPVEQPAGLTPADRVPDYFIREADIRSFGVDGELKHHLRAANLSHFPDDSAQLDGLEITRLPGPWTLVAAKGMAPAGLDSLILEGDVRVRTQFEDDAAELRTEALRLQLEARQMESLGAVRLESSRVTATAERFRADLGRRDFELLGEVRVEHQP